ncbi:AraC family transcriptional regulator [Bacteroides sp. 214]|uniref:helix-turn-helix domain-containing protein n=1 Tax=Bacteroides sp. 214 TaxID=2302935 RepID=UPI0013D3C1AA|nr:helix-turn-helix domain-containing protein [Bacteroides sp. 214]NDW13709.1 AraC family transcriptional regulator [Bacteroides sp. 214]
MCTLKRLTTFALYVLLPFFFIYGVEQNEIDSLRQVAQTSEGTKKLEVYASIYTIAVHGDDMQAELNAIDDLEKESRRQGNLMYEAFALLARSLCYSNYNEYQLFYNSLPEAFRFFQENNLTERYNSLVRIEIDTYFRDNKPQKALQRCQDMYQEAKQTGTPETQALAAYSFGMCYRMQGLHEQSEPFFVESIQTAKQIENLEQKVSYQDPAYRMLVSYLISRKRGEESLTYLKEWNELLAEEKRAIIEKSGNLSANTGNQFNCDLMMIETLGLLGRYEEAEQYIERAEHFVEGKQDLVQENLNDAKLSFYNYKEDYEKVLELSELCLQFYRRWPDGFQEIHRLVDFKKRALLKLSRYKEACEAYEELAILTDSITTVDNLQQLNELRTVYELDKIVAEKERQCLQLIISVGGSLLLLLALLVYIFYSHKLKKRNLALYKQIQEIARIEAEANQAFAHIPKEELTREMKLYIELTEVMQTQKLFINSDIDRKKLADTLGTNEVYLANAIREGCGETFSSYIAKLRLQYALELLTNNPELTLDAIAVESGHASYSPFFRGFSKQYGMNPSEYRKFSAMKKSVR